MKRLSKYWRIVVIGLLFVGSLFGMLLVPDLVAWTAELIDAQFAQYPPGYGTPMMF